MEFCQSGKVKTLINFRQISLFSSDFIDDIIWRLYGPSVIIAAFLGT